MPNMPQTAVKANQVLATTTAASATRSAIRPGPLMRRRTLAFVRGRPGAPQRGPAAGLLPGPTSIQCVVRVECAGLAEGLGAGLSDGDGRGVAVGAVHVAAVARGAVVAVA